MNTAEITHAGVKGMKWGVRKDREVVGNTSSPKPKLTRKQKNAPNPAYSVKQRSRDSMIFGSGGSVRINRRMNEGATHKEARKKEIKRTAIIGGTLLAMEVVPRIINASAPKLIDLAQHRVSERGKTAAANLFADSKGLTSYQTLNMTFDPIKKSFV